MAATEILAVGTSTTASADAVAVAGTTLCLKTTGSRNLPAGCKVLVLVKTTIGYTLVAVLSANNPCFAFAGNVSAYQVERQNTGDSVGVDVA